MSATLYRTATEFTANEVTFNRGSVADIVLVGVYHSTDPEFIPEVSDFISSATSAVQLVDSGPLQEGTKIDILALIGPRSGVAALILAPGLYQRWVLLVTASEDIIRRPDTVTIT